jgi:hypothetical protein
MNIRFLNLNMKDHIYNINAGIIEWINSFIMAVCTYSKTEIHESQGADDREHECEETASERSWCRDVTHFEENLV